jgi:hypothetical protein
MQRTVLAAAIAVASLSTAGCVQDSAQATNKQMSTSKVYIGALTCDIAGGSGYLIAGSREARCIYSPEKGEQEAYKATIRNLGLDLGETRPMSLVWKVFSLDTRPRQDVLAGQFVGETAAITTGQHSGGNWLYGGDGQTILQETATFLGENSGFSIQYGAFNMQLTRIQGEPKY